MTRYKGQLHCCLGCDHPTIASILQKQDDNRDRAVALDKLSARERQLLGL